MGDWKGALDRCAYTQADHDTIRAHIEALEADARRYRWLRKHAVTGSIGFDAENGWLNADEPESEWDAAIDTAMKDSTHD